MSDGAEDSDRPKGLSLLPRGLTPEELAALPVLESLDDLVIDDLTEAEYQAFLDALNS